MSEPVRRRFDLYAVVQRLQAGYGRRLSNRLKRLLSYAVLAVVAFAVLSTVGVQVTSKAHFCVSCHYMRPYYDSWKASKHKDVECVDCHFPPGLESELQRKFKASVQIVKYVTKQYGTRPWTEIDDRSCLRSGCHVKHLLPKAEVRPGISFDHLPHLTQFRRVTRLRCTSCHSQIVQGNHMVATLSTCFLCHFKHMPAGGSLSKCSTCHKLPIQNTKGKQGYDHKMANERRVDCLNCHSDVVRGQGRVPRERCVACHSEPERLNKYDDVEFMHLNHVTNHKIDCLRCHEEIEHGLVRTEPTPPLACATCHPKQHLMTQQLYSGEVPNVPGHQPNPMYAARVACAACHLEHKKLPSGSDVYTAGLAGCANCHGENFGAGLARDRAEIAGLIGQVRPALIRARGVAKAMKNAAKRTRVTALCDAADEKVATVQRGGGVHNIPLARQLLRIAANEINEAMASAGAAYRLRLVSRPSYQGMSTDCLNCHTKGYPMVPIRMFGTDFSHERHVGVGRLECGACHTINEPGTSGHGRVKIQDRAGCRNCHQQRMHSSPHANNWRKQHGAYAQTPGSNCAICHSDSRCSSCHKLPMPHARGWVMTHGSVARQSPSKCSSCHQRSDCLVCHTRKRPPAGHLESGFAKNHGQKANAALCAMCHSGKAGSSPARAGEAARAPSVCTICHGGVALPHSTDFKTGGHAKSVQANPQTCAKCHASQKFCLECHEGLPPSSHEQKSFRGEHGQKANTAFCERCHDRPVCTSCHTKLTKSPHADDWTMTHKAVARFDKKAKCFLCHKIDYCQQCHEGAVLH